MISPDALLTSIIIANIAIRHPTYFVMEALGIAVVLVVILIAVTAWSILVRLFFAMANHLSANILKLSELVLILAGLITGIFAAYEFFQNYVFESDSFEAIVEDLHQFISLRINETMPIVHRVKAYLRL